jgi:hypothetical protein
MRALATAVVLAAAVAPAAQSSTATHKPVVVVAKRGVRLLAWDHGGKICTELAAAAGRRASSCGSARALGYEQLPYALASETFVGGVTSSKARTVEVVFASGAKLDLRTQSGRRYRGRRHGRVRFFAGREGTVTTVSSIVAKDANGNTVQSTPVAPPSPQPIPNPNPCTCPPTPIARACPLIACAYPQTAWTSR